MSSCKKKSDDQENLTIKKVKANTAIVPPCEDARGADRQSTECDGNPYQSRATNSGAGLWGLGDLTSRHQDIIPNLNGGVYSLLIV